MSNCVIFLLEKFFLTVQRGRYVFALPYMIGWNFVSTMEMGRLGFRDMEAWRDERLTSRAFCGKWKWGLIYCGRYLTYRPGYCFYLYTLFMRI